jgi:hypothetical protein
MNNQEPDEKMRQIIAKAWADEAFKERLLADATAMLKEEGVAVPEGVLVKAVENTDKIFHMVIPTCPQRPLTEEQLDAVSGGGLPFELIITPIIRYILPEPSWP